MHRLDNLPFQESIGSTVSGDCTKFGGIIIRGVTTANSPAKIPNQKQNSTPPHELDNDWWELMLLHHQRCHCVPSLVCQSCTVVGWAIIEALMFGCHQKHQGGAIIEWGEIVKGNILKYTEMLSLKGSPSLKTTLISKKEPLLKSWTYTQKKTLTGVLRVPLSKGVHHHRECHCQWC